MKRPMLTGILLGLLIFGSIPLTVTSPAIVFGKDINMKEGLWEITTRMQMQGMPMQMPVYTFRRCITREDMVPRQEDRPGQECKVLKTDVKGDTVTWVMECRDNNGTTRAEGRATYRGESFDGEVRVTMESAGMKGMEMIQQISGRWMGSCE